MKTLFRKLISLFIKKPKKSFDWTVEDFNRAKLYCKYQPHPNDKNLTLWNYVRDWGHDSVMTLHKLNLYLKLK